MPRWNAEMECSMVMNKFYIYILFDWMGTPRYVGKGCGNRDTDHERYTDPVNWMKNEFIERTWTMLDEIPKVRIMENILEKDAFEIEKMLIGVIGRLDLSTGSLTNMTEGGEGSVDAGRIGGRASKAKLTLEEKRERGRFVGLTGGRKGAITGHNRRTPEERSEFARKGARALHASLTPEQHSSNSRIGALAMHANMTPEQYIARSRTQIANMTLEQRSARSRAGGRATQAKLTPEQRSDKGRRGALARWGNKN